MKTKIAALAGLALLLPLASCGQSEDGDDKADETVTLHVFAAASLTDTFTELGEQFEADHDGVKVEFNFDGSSNLVTQIQEGAPADVFASADEANMEKATGDDLVEGEPADFATNTLQIVTPPDNPAGIEDLSDLASDDVDVVLCAPEVPCGAASETVEKAAGIEIDPVSEEQKVTDVLGKVTAGEADAGLVYVTDATGAGDDVKAIDFAEAEDAVNIYPIGALAGSKNADLAQEFVDLVTSSEGQKVLADAGFGAP